MLSNKIANNQEKMLDKLDLLQSDFRLISADVAGIKKSLEDHKKDTTVNLDQHEQKIERASTRIDAIQSEQTATKAALAAMHRLGGGAFTLIIIIGGWYLSGVNGSVKQALDTATANAQRIEQIRQIQDERKERISALEDRTTKLREDVIAIRRGNMR